MTHRSLVLWLGLEGELLAANSRLVHQAAFGMDKHGHAFMIARNLSACAGLDTPNATMTVINSIKKPERFIVDIFFTCFVFFCFNPPRMNADKHE
ncbi:MAG: hypothetical protein JRI63_07140 [Deltaproteobacteria bacterium]|nr:hypothetical protein [Deltaproteobacteria bacterium]